MKLMQDLNLSFALEAEIVTRTADNCVLGGAVPPWCISEDAAQWTATSLEIWGTGDSCRGSIPPSSIFHRKPRSEALC
jgi:hypothetical protein